MRAMNAVRHAMHGLCWLLALSMGACVKGKPATPPMHAVATAREWADARARLESMRRAQPVKPYVQRVRVAMFEPTTGRRYEARGAVAVHPREAARMLLVGPGGGTALDLWVTKDRFRMTVPAIHLEKRGGRDPFEARGLPVGMLRWWFLDPLAGRLLEARIGETSMQWTLREGRATVQLAMDGKRISAERRELDAVEAIDWEAPSLAPQNGVRVTYTERRHGLRVEVLVEEVLTTAPDPEAFIDPDEAERAP
jgi:hypothetical protein